jgi:hypothetical protein
VGGRVRVAEHVPVTGHLPAERVSAALHAADVAAFPFTAGASTKSGALLSAFAHRLPTVVTAADPPDPDLVDGETVVVAPRVRDPQALVDALGRLLDDPSLRERGWPRAVPRWAAGAAGRGSPRHTGSCTRMSPAGPMPDRFSDILVVDLPGGIGDLCRVLSAVHALHRRHPGAALRVLTHAPGAELLRSDPAVAEVHRVRKHDEHAAVVAELDRRAPDLVVSTTRFDGIAEEIDARGMRSVTNLWRRPPADEPVARRYVAILAAEGLVDSAYRPPLIHLTGPELARADRTLASLVPSGPPVVLVSGAGMAASGGPTGAGSPWR